MKRPTTLTVVLIGMALGLGACSQASGEDEAARPSRNGFSSSVKFPLIIGEKSQIARFKSLHRDAVTYKVCVKGPFRLKTTVCKFGTTGQSGQISRISFVRKMLGVYRVRWFVRKTLVGEAEYSIAIE